jgi:hypothetical protein
LVVQGPGTQATNRIRRSEVRLEDLQDLRPLVAPVIGVVLSVSRCAFHVGVTPARRQAARRPVSPRKVEDFDKVREPTRLQVNVRQERTPCLGIPLHVGAAQAGDEPPDVAQRQAEFMGGRRQEFLGGRPPRRSAAWPAGLDLVG